MISSPYEGLLDEFKLDARERVDQIERALLALESATVSKEDQPSLWESAARELHTLKGNAGMMGLTDVQMLAHRLEDQLKETPREDPDLSGILGGLDDVRAMLEDVPAAGEASGAAPADAAPKRKSAGSVRVPFTSLDHLIDHLAEIVIQRNQLATLLAQGQREATGVTLSGSLAVQSWRDAVASFDSMCKTLEIIQSGVTRLRMVPLHTLFGSLGRVVHDESAARQKRVVLETKGGDTPLDKSLLEMANEALGHLVRNSVIHGVELPDERKRLGKPVQATITITAALKGDEIRIVVADDGRGVDTDALLRAAVARGIDPSTVADPMSLLFQAGVSTKADVDLGAGRGVGLSAVEQSVRGHGGRVAVRSDKGRGTEFVLTLPLTVSIVTALMLQADGEAYAMPMQSVVESRRYTVADGHRVNHAGIYRWRDELIPLVDLGYTFATAPAARESGYVIVVDVGGKRRGILTDVITGIQEVVVKGLDPIVGSPPGVLGSTVLGDGRAVLILDPSALVDLPPFIQEVA